MWLVKNDPMSAIGNEIQYIFLVVLVAGFAAAMAPIISSPLTVYPAAHTKAIYVIAILIGAGIIFSMARWAQGRLDIT